MKPREKLLQHGAKSLLDYELIAILLRTGSTKHNVMELAKLVLSLLNELKDFKNLSVEDLLNIHGIEKAKATTIIAAVELGRRLETRAPLTQYQIKQTKDVYQMLFEEMVHLNQEHLIVLNLNVKSKVIKKERLYIGTDSSVTVAVKDVYRSAIKLGANGIIVVHNHPSGDASPSQADHVLTNQLIDAGNLLNIQFVDHIVMGRNEYYSFMLNKKMKAEID